MLRDAALKADQLKHARACGAGQIHGMAAKHRKELPP
jgi:hypothetical protein